MMIDLIRKPSRGVAIIYVRKNTCVLNAAASKLLGLCSGMRLLVRYDTEDKFCGRDRIYVASTTAPFGYELTKRNRTFEVHSTALCRALANCLDGEGAYRVCQEVNKVCDGQQYYEIFFRKYE